MSQEDKFKEAQRLYETANADQRYVLERLFPELRESQDDEIRESIIGFLITVSSLKDGMTLSNEDFDSKVILEWVAWLEKQTIPKVRTGIEWVNTIDDACDKRYLEEYSKGEYCHEQSFKWGFQEGVDWLEKQDEPKSNERKDFISIPFGTDSEFIKEAIAIPDGCVATIEGNKIHIKKR